MLTSRAIEGMLDSMLILLIQTLLRYPSSGMCKNNATCWKFTTIKQSKPCLERANGGNILHNISPRWRMQRRRRNRIRCLRSGRTWENGRCVGHYERCLKSGGRMRNGKCVVSYDQQYVHAHFSLPLMSCLCHIFFELILGGILGL